MRDARQRDQRAKDKQRLKANRAKYPFDDFGFGGFNFRLDEGFGLTERRRVERVRRRAVVGVAAKAADQREDWIRLISIVSKIQERADALKR